MRISRFSRFLDNEFLNLAPNPLDKLDNPNCLKNFSVLQFYLLHQCIEMAYLIASSKYSVHPESFPFVLFALKKKFIFPQEDYYG